jgi:excisionase family DNA binding protein
MQENLLSADQVASYLKVDRFTVYRLVSQKKIPAFKVGNQWRFKKKMIDAWLLENSNLDVSQRKSSTKIF